MGRPDLTAVLLSMRNSCSTIGDAIRFEIDTHFVITEVFSIETLRANKKTKTRAPRSSRPGPRRHLALVEKRKTNLNSAMRTYWLLI